MELTEKEVKDCHRELAELITGSDTILATILATQDGLLVTSESNDAAVESDAIAAMSASLISLADALAGQAGKALVDNVISEAESSTLAILHAGSLILTVIGKAGVNIGLVLVSARRTAKKIEALTLRFGQENEEVLRGVEMLKDPEAVLERIMKEMQEMHRRRTHGTE